MTAPATTLLQRLQRTDLWSGAHLAVPPVPGLASGFTALDAALPGGGWPRGELTELLPARPGIGEFSLLLPALARLAAEEGWIAVVAPPWPLHAPAWQAAGLPLARLLMVRARGQEAAWACEQLLASGALAALLAWLPQADGRQLRRLQLAASHHPGPAWLFRPTDQAGTASPAPLRLALAPAPGGLAVTLLKRRGPPLARPLVLTVQRPAASTRRPSSTPLAAPQATSVY